MATRFIADENLDLYVLVAAAVIVALLGAFGVAGITTLASVILALLATLAYSRIRSRRYVAEIASAQRRDPFSLFLSEFPDDLIRRRATAKNVLLIGLSLRRTVQSGLLTELRQLLLSGAKIRMLVVDPTSEDLVRAAGSHVPGGGPPERLRSRIRSTLDELSELRTSTGVI